MTEAEWLAGTDPRPMLEYVRGKVSDFKLRLFACACVRRVWHLLGARGSRDAVDSCESHPERSGEMLSNDFLTAHWAVCELNARRRHQPIGRAHVAAAGAAAQVLNRSSVFNYSSAGHIAASGASRLAAEAVKFEALAVGAAGRPRAKAERIAQSRLLRDIVRNPFCPVFPVTAARFTWPNGAATQLSQAAYEHRRLPEGTLDTSRLTLLADALEDAGCTDAELLGHLRGPGPHVRGCWAVDLVLGKS